MHTCCFSLTSVGNAPIPTHSAAMLSYYVRGKRDNKSKYQPNALDWLRNRPTVAELENRSNLSLSYLCLKAFKIGTCISIERTVDAGYQADSFGHTLQG